MIERWQIVLRFYEDCIEARHDMKSQLDLVKQISTSKYAEEFYPSTSMATLNISSFENYADQVKNPSINVNFLGNHLFKITFSNNPSQTHKIEKFECHQSQAFSLLESLFLRMQSGKSGN